MNPDLKRYYPQDYILKYTLIPLIYKFITPNQLTIMRYISTPFVLFLLYTENYVIGVPLFFLAAFTDMLDGSLARVKGKITRWGIINDPIADKLLILPAIALFTIRYLNLWLVVVLFFVEALTVGIPIVLRNKFKDKAIPSNIFGKLKFTCEVLALLVLTIGVWTKNFDIIPFSSVLIVIAIIFAISSLLFNFYKMMKNTLK